MDVTPTVPEGVQVIDSYGPGRFRVAGEVWDSSVIVVPEKTLVWPVPSIADLSFECLAPVFSADPAIEVLLIGCGEKMAMVPAALKQQSRAQGVGIDSMDTGAACRTYNVLLAEGRRVAAALIPL
ncbi:MAG TPA: hypothetical protein DCS82_01490 [Rhodospirillaceae bacterium]|nr:hypothetical protein [Rhodospirillaceae bacterium]HAA92380.1 hypothetical protein [Rhodospirillaceae bacterium]HAT34363.1 hypothetical protein [Rhodospirillaceae bacterium]